MSDKEMALQQVNDIFNVIKGSFKTVISGTLMIATGIGIAAIPLIEWIFDKTLDPMILKTSTHSEPLIFVVRTIFYWLTFTLLSKAVISDKEETRDMHPIIKKVWSIGKYFPIIPVTTAAMLALSGYSDLIAPILLIQIGILFAVFGALTSGIVRVTAWCLIIIGLIGIYLSTLSIANLWAYLVVAQGIAFIIMGLLLNQEQREQKSN